MIKWRNIKLSDWYQSILWMVGLCAIALVFLYSIEHQLLTGVEQLKISIEENGDKRNLVTEEWVYNKVEELLEGNLDAIKLAQLDLSWLEAKIEEDSRIDNVEVYLDGKNIMHVEVKIKRPIVRILSANGEKYYLDLLGEKVQLGNHVAIRVPIATGFIDPYEDNWEKTDTHNLNHVFALADFIRKDSFLTALVEQIYMDEGGMITIIPKIGRERIYVGSSQDLEFKMENLKLSYKYILKREGWGKFKELKLDIPNQVVALS